MYYSKKANITENQRDQLENIPGTRRRCFSINTLS